MITSILIILAIFFGPFLIEALFYILRSLFAGESGSSHRRPEMENAIYFERKLADVNQSSLPRGACHQPECLRENREDARFCGACGADLHDPARRYHVLLLDTGTAKVSAIKMIRKALKVGLKEAKDLADRPPQLVGLHLNEEQARRLSEGFMRAGSTVETRLAAPAGSSTQAV